MIQNMMNLQMSKIARHLNTNHENYILNEKDA